MTSRPEPNADWVLVGRSSNTTYYQAGEDILIVLPDAGLKDDAVSARENVAYQTEFARARGRRIGLVVYLSTLLGQEPAARREYSELDPALFKGGALVVLHPLARAVGSFFLGLSRPRFPARLVESIDDGIAWLRTLEERRR